MQRLVIPTLIVVTLAFAGCDPGAGITWVNETDQTVDVYLGDDLDDFDGSLPPHSSTEAATIKAVWEDVVHRAVRVNRDVRENDSATRKDVAFVSYRHTESPK